MQYELQLSVSLRNWTVSAVQEQLHTHDVHVLHAMHPPPLLVILWKSLVYIMQ